MATKRNLSLRKAFCTEFQQEYNHALDKVVYDRYYKHRLQYLRPSQMPFCAGEVFTRVATHELRQPTNLVSSFYTTVGTHVHTIIQKFITQGGNVMGNYFCSECGTRYPQSFKHECCGFSTNYEEITIDYGGVMGHIDCVYRDNAGNLWIVDFKTTSIKGAGYKQSNPGAVYREQIETYAVLFELQYKEKITGIADVFLTRDNPTNPLAIWSAELTDEKRKEVKARLRAYKERHKAVFSAKTKNDVLALIAYPKCGNEWCSFCRKSDADKQDTLMRAARLAHEKRILPLSSLYES